MTIYTQARVLQLIFLVLACGFAYLAGREQN